MTDRITVLFVQQYPDGGSVTSLLDLIRGLDRDRHRAVVAFRTDNPFVAEFEALGAEVVTMYPEAQAVPRPSAAFGRRDADGGRSRSLRREVRRWFRRDWPAYRRLLELAREVQPDVIHANNDVRINRDAMLVGRRLRVPVVAHVRWIYDIAGDDVSQRTDRLLARTAAHLFFISRVAADAYAPLKVPARRCSVLDNPFDVDDYLAEPSAEVASELGVPGSRPTIVHLGRIIPWKGQDVLLRAMPAVCAAVPEARALFVGSATDAKGEAFERELEALVDELGLHDVVVFAGARRDVASVLALGAVIVHSSTLPEPFGRVIVEAMAAGRPVIGAAAGGVPEIIDDGETGLLVPPNDPDALAEALIWVLTHPGEAAAMGAAARATAQRRFSIAAHAAAVEAVYREVLA